MKNINIPHVTFVATPESDVDRVVITAHTLASGFFAQKGFVVLPTPVPSSGVVILPPLPYQKISGFWKTLKNTPSIPQTMSPDIPLPIRQKLSEYLAKYTCSSTNTLEKQWKNIEVEFWKKVHELFTACPISQLKIHVSPWGTIASWGSLTSKKKNQRLVMYIREDASVSHIAEVVLSSLVELDEPNLALSWEERESIVDFLLTKTPLSHLFSHYSPTLLGIHKNTDALKRASSQYMARISFRMEKHFYKHGRELYHNNKRIDHTFTSSQLKLMLLLLDHENQTADYDSIAQAIWNNEESFSLWAINKHMQRLSKKVKLCVGADLIEPVRGRGYIFINSRMGV